MKVGLKSPFKDRCCATFPLLNIHIRIMQIKIKHTESSTWQLHPDNHKTLAVKVTGGPCGMCAGTDGVTKAQAAADLCVFRDLRGSHREQCRAKAGSWLTPPSQGQKQRLGESPWEILETETATCKRLLPHGRLRKPCYNLLTLWHVGQGSSKVWI